MFATFTTSMDARSKSASPAAQASTRPKRHVAMRACDRCRTNRIRCDDNQPCKHCRTKGLECSKGRPSDSPGPNYVEMLKSKVSELEAQLQKRTSVELPTNSLPSPPDSGAANTPAYKSSERQVPKQWLGFWKTHPNRSLPQYYGPTSFEFFIHRLGKFIEVHKNQPQLNAALQEAASLDQLPRSRGSCKVKEPLTRRQEEALLSLFWQSYHSVFPILDENEFRNQYTSLWPASYASPANHSMRKPSAIVDIILALCMQYSTSAMASGALVINTEARDSGWEGRYLYERCQSRLQAEVSDPTISALQCYIYSVVYLINASSFTLARAALTSAVHVAYALGIHREAPENTQIAPQLLLRGIWSAIYHLDSLLSLALGRPHLVHSSDNMLNTQDNDSLPTLNGNVPMDDGINWMRYHSLSIKLLTAMRTISMVFSAKCNEIIALHNLPSIYSDSSHLETVASFLRQNVKSLRTWAREVPPPLKLRRKDNGESFSTTRSQVEFDMFAPLWLQRQRVLLELLYHNVLQYQFRTFIRYPSADSSEDSLGPAITTAADGIAMSALNHAMATIHIIYQALTETNVLNSWNRAYQYLWEATLTAIGFTLSRPLCPFNVSARKAIDTAFQALDIFASNGIEVAINAAQVAKELSGMSANIMSSKSTTPPMQVYQPPSSSPSPQLLQSPLTSDTSLQAGLFASLNNPTTMMLPFEAGLSTSDGIGTSFTDPIGIGSAPLAMDLSTTFSSNWYEGIWHNMASSADHMLLDDLETTTNESTIQYGSLSTLG